MLIEKSSRGKASLNRISELLDAKVDVKDKAPLVTDLDEVKGKIEFRHLSFRYPAGENHNINVKLSENDTSASNPDANSTDINIACARVPFTAEDCSVSGEAKEVLHDVSFTIEAGESVGIVGRTGAGKTTLVDLILRVWNVEDGTLFVDDRDVNTISIHSLRDGCAYVPQDNFLFSDTIANNIAFAVDKNPSGGLQRRIRQAAIAADVDEDISGFKEGYETVLGERGVTVSGGQKQRISIARALMKDAPILILDDSVSAVDTGTERVILDHLKERVGKTTILIAHRISTVEEMDKIIFLEDGCVKAVGSHRELYETCKEYRKMVDLQKLEEEVKQ
ncbi:MAG: ABC transporter ATP-binding protein/permease [Lachnospiraceae bacterium]|nr:ABC transporter ATP-binding protein/permease [Lachnospiraceae bacterium]